MRTFIRISMIFILALFLSSCATGPLIIPEKYSLDAQLERVTEIYKYRVMEWDKVDQQSLILRTGPSDYYLLVLKIPSPELMFVERIRITSTSSMVRAGFDRVILYGPGTIRNSYTIERMYRIKGNEQKHEIWKQLAPDADKKEVVIRGKGKSI